jgi:tetratricopeptide (TPR) repeat protein
MARGAEVRAQLILLAARVASPEGDIDSLRREGEEQATRAGDPHSLTRILCSYGWLKILRGHTAESFRILEAAVRSADESGDRELRVAARCALAFACVNAGRLTTFLTLAEQQIGLSREDPQVGAHIIGISPYLYTLAMRGWALATMGRFREAATDLDRAISVSRERREFTTGLVAQGNHLALLEATGDARGSLLRAREAIEPAQRTGNQAVLSFAYERLARTCLLNHQWGEALNAADRSLAIAREGNTGLHYEPVILTGLSDAHRGLGDSFRARAKAEEAVAKARQLDAQMFEVRAQIALARALLSFEDAALGDLAGSALDSAMTLVDEIGVEAYRPFIHEARAELARVLEDPSRREQELREAHRRYDENEAKGHAQRLAKELGL